MDNYTTNQPRTGRENERPTSLETLGGWSRPRRVLLVRRPMEDMKKRRNEPPRREFAQLTIPGLELVTDLDLDQRWQLIIYWAFRKYKLIYRLYPPLLGDQIMLPLA